MECGASREVTQRSEVAKADATLGTAGISTLSGSGPQHVRKILTFQTILLV